MRDVWNGLLKQRMHGILNGVIDYFYKAFNTDEKIGFLLEVNCLISNKNSFDEKMPQLVNFYDTDINGEELYWNINVVARFYKHV